MQHLCGKGFELVSSFRKETALAMHDFRYDSQDMALKRGFA